MSDIVIYEDGTLALSATVENETVWLSQKQMAELFDKSIKTINEHIKNIYKEGELEENSTIRKFQTVQKEGKREVFSFHSSSCGMHIRLQTTKQTSYNP